MIRKIKTRGICILDTCLCSITNRKLPPGPEVLDEVREDNARRDSRTSCTRRTPWAWRGTNQLINRLSRISAMAFGQSQPNNKAKCLAIGQIIKAKLYNSYLFFIE